MSIAPDTLRPETLAELEANLDQMKTANYFLRVAADQVPEALLIIEPSATSEQGPRVLFSNAAAAILVGVEPERGLRGMNLSDLAAGELDASTLLQSLQEAVNQGGTHECECRVQNLYGREPQMCRWRVRAVFNSMRKLLNYTIIINPKQGISSTAIKTGPLKGDSLDDQSEQLKQANLAVLAQGIAHDVNNLIGPAIMRLSDLLQKIPEQSETQEELQHIFDALKRARQFTSQVVTSCKDKSGTVKPVDLASIIHDTAKFAGAGSNVELRVRLAEGLLRPLADGVKVSQVLQNLILNGIQAMPDGGYMDIEAVNTEFAPGQDEVLKPGRYLRITVRDRGCGISPENMGRLFRETFTTKPSGNGIGLTTCKRFIKSQEGDIRVTSRLNIGTEFTVYLPASDAVVEPQNTTPRKLRPRSPIPLVQGDGRVLIVDDEDPLRLAAKKILQRQGYQVVDTDNGQDALKIYQSLYRTGTAPDVVLMDLTLRGGMNGAETAAEILRFDPDARLVVCSGSVNEDIQNAFLDKGFVAVLPKPYEAGELTQTVQDVIRQVRRA